MNLNRLKIYRRKPNNSFIPYYRAYSEQRENEITKFLEENNIIFFKKKGAKKEPYPKDIVINYDGAIKIGEMLDWKLSSDLYTKRLKALVITYKFKYFLDESYFLEKYSGGERSI